MSVKSILLDYLRKYDNVNIAVAKTLVNSAIEADVEEVTLEAASSYKAQSLTAPDGKVWTKATIDALPVTAPDAPVPATFTLTQEGVVFTSEIDEESNTITITPDIAVANKTALVVNFTFDTPTVVPGYPVQSFRVLGADGVIALTTGTSTLDFSAVTPLTLKMENKCAQEDYAGNFIVKSQEWTVTLADAPDAPDAPTEP